MIIGSRRGVLNKKERFARARKLFASAILEQRSGDTTAASVAANLCLELLRGLETAEETAAGESNQGICEPEYLHVASARQRFRQEGINV